MVQHEFDFFIFCFCYNINIHVVSSISYGCGMLPQMLPTPSVWLPERERGAKMEYNGNCIKKWNNQ